jgi:DNA-binding MarR family transcriptional regulator
MGALTRLADELERVGLVRRDRSEHDRRAVELAITPDGRRQALAGKRLMVELLNEIVAPYTNTEVDILVSLLQRLLSRLQDTAELSIPSGPQSAASNPRGNRRSPRATPKRKTRT